MKKKLFTILTAMLFLVVFVAPVKAEFTACDFLPCANGTVDGTQADSDSVNTTLENLFGYSTSLIFVGLIGFGILKIISASIKIIRSENNADKYQEGQKTIKNVVIGVAMIFVGIIGLVLITVLFDATGIFNTEVENPDGVNIPIINGN